MRAKALHDHTTELDENQTAEVEKRVLDGGGRENLSQFKHAIRREVIRADPHRAEQRRLQAKTKRDVTKWHKPDGTSSININLEPHEAEQAYAQLDLLAKQVKRPGRSQAQSRADVFMDLGAPRSALLYPRLSREELKGGSWA